MGFSRILFATDLGSGARRSLARVSQLARAYGSEVLLVHVTTGWHAFVTSGLAQLHAQERLTSWAGELEREGIQTRVRVYRGSPADVVLEIADLERSELILIGAGDVWHERRRLGSTAHAIALGARRPVWIDVACAEGAVKRIICGVDGSEASRAALAVARELARRLDTPWIVAAGLTGPDSVVPGASAEEHALELESYRHQRIAELEAFLASADVGPNVERHFEWGRGSEVLRDLAQECAADLVVVGRTGASLLRRVLLGGTPERLLRDAPCAILLAGAGAHR
jgi:nucleotide-binding universal stress UspA family protein